jgi:WXG100 family type VII secretion target
VGGYAVDPAQLQVGDGQLVDAAGQARVALAQVRARAVELLGTGWQGSAAVAFQQGWELWFDGAHAMLAALEEMAALLGRSGSGYEATDDAVRAGLAGRP